MDGIGANVPEYGVGELAGAIKRTLEGAFSRVRVRGELTEVKPYASGHIYLSLKEENAKIEAVIWKGTVSRVGLRPENGMEVVATGRLSTYADRSKYQLVIEKLEYAGAGAMLARIEALKAALLKEGLFDTERKRALPLLPRVIGVVTSPQGAVLQDIRTTLARRFPRHVILWPVPVQGEGAAEKIAAAIRGFSELPPGGAIPRPDVIIVARGGGSLEDLMAFNEEVVVRAAAASTIPLISAVGHETDTTLIDFASDRRAPTPTAAAELAVPARVELAADLAQRAARMDNRITARLREARLHLTRAEAGLPDLPALVNLLRQRLDDRAERLRAALPGFVVAKRAELTRLGAGLRHPREAIAAGTHALQSLDQRLRAAWARASARRLAAPALARLSAGPVLALIREQAARVEGLAARLEAVSYNAVLARGFALVQGTDGTAFSSAAQVAAGASLTLTFQDGVVKAVAAGGKPRQGSLF
ncbi:exodeoxyribonuclease VII large subunit [Sediminicoccus sp. KRV36]|uniref:exodeoxyribonuclease VII large subunit n=1 Tax=Sediminicoccus sp. KRV36 TaxID=3133721 RepID=UPI002010972C|nr:exodeoxyribonuclease VII large subunit [Sediminicoccus rosea]UPY35124.1 exodeoxyribonuclease VII large subunit [Sediminicoccus rosea]